MDFLFYQYDQLTFSLCISAGILLFIQVLYYIIVYGKVGGFRLPQPKDIAQDSASFPPISVVIVTRDEQENLKEKLPVILEQQYPNFEVVIVNNASNDETEFMLKVFQKLYSNLKIVNLYEKTPNKFQGKKYPLSLGIKSAKNDYILLTNANCIPNSYFWIMNMAKGIYKQKNIVLGFNLYEKKNTLLNRFIQYDSLNNAMNYEGMALLGHPYKATGDNLIISKKNFFDNGGFISIYNIASGDMELYVNRVAKKKNTSIILSAEAYIKTEAPQSFSAWIRQKKKKIRSAHYYHFWDKFIVAMPTWAMLFFYTILTFLFVVGFTWQWIVIGIIFKWIIQILLFYKGTKVLMKNKLYIFAPLFEIFFLIFNMLIGMNTLFSKKDRWE
ncbi:MAG: glycosyltransferase [Bacteroidales bacterium]|jgi:glycosyltransferase involved in cell wall biosynthesis|nr:glycosyltransferase [Bacteroidales bacterium]